MGITGLWPFVENACSNVNVREFSGCTAAIDATGLLHQGAHVYACASKLMRGEDTDIYINHCMQYVNMLLSKNIKPILVFDGMDLPAKAENLSKRRELRDAAREKADELLHSGKKKAARKYVSRSVEVTHDMTLRLIKECRKHNVDCIVAPYEADAQLAYLNINNIAQVVIAEDTDLIVFGCTKVIFKMNSNGYGTLFDQNRLPSIMKCPTEYYSFDKFRQMCILSGCDYLPSLPGIGLASARKFVSSTPDAVNYALKDMPIILKKPTVVVTKAYQKSFLEAEAAFKYQYVFNPLDREMVRLNDPDDDEDFHQDYCVNAGELLNSKTAFQLAIGNLDPDTLEERDTWNPDDRNNKKVPVNNTNVNSYPSIWSSEFQPHVNKNRPWHR